MLSNGLAAFKFVTLPELAHEVINSKTLNLVSTLCRLGCNIFASLTTFSYFFQYTTRSDAEIRRIDYGDSDKHNHLSICRHSASVSTCIFLFVIFIRKI